MIYLVVFIYLLVFVVKFDINKKEEGADFTYYMVLVVFIAIAGLRYKVGGDSLAYYETFKEIPLLSDLFDYDFSETRYDPLWIVLSSISKTIIDDFAFFQIIHATIVNVIIFRFIKQNTMYRFTAIFLYFCGAYLYFNMEVMREILAICVFLLGYPYFRDKKWFQFYLFAIVAFLFHSSAMILFLFPLFRYLKINLIGISIILGFFYFSLYFEAILKLGLFASRVTEKYDNYSDLSLNFFGILYAFIFYCFIPILIMYFNTKLDSEKIVFEELTFTYFFLAFIFLAMSGFGRFLNYVTPFAIIYLGDFTNKIIHNERLHKIRFTIVIGMLLIIAFPKIQYYLIDTSKIVAGTHQYNLWIPYSTIFTEEEYDFRDPIYQAGFD
jgi:hypothetical protein